MQAGHQEDRLQFRAQVAIHLCYLELVVEVRQGSKAANQCAGVRQLANSTRSPEKLAASILGTPSRPASPSPASRGQRRRVLRGVLVDGHDELVEQLAARMGDVQVAVGKRVEATG